MTKDQKIRESDLMSDFAKEQYFKNQEKYLKDKIKKQDNTIKETLSQVPVNYQFNLSVQV